MILSFYIFLRKIENENTNYLWVCLYFSDLIGATSKLKMEYLNINYPVNPGFLG